MRDQSIEDFLASLGYEGEGAHVARQALMDAGLTRSGKSRIAIGKLPAAEAALAARLVRACASEACQAEAGRITKHSDNRTIIMVPRESCDVCGGSENARAVQEMARALGQRSKKRLLIIGGTPNAETELNRLLPPSYEVRFIRDNVNKTAKDAAQDAGWADFIVIWASTPIGHKTTGLYKPYKPLTVSRRSISALASEIRLSLAANP